MKFVPQHQYKPFVISLGIYCLELGLKIPIRFKYRLGLAESGIAQLYSSFTSLGVTFPYEVQNILSIGGSNNGQYPYFFDWEISWESSCERVLAPITVSNGNLDATFATSDAAVFGGQIISFTDNTVGATKWLWDFGDGTTSTDQNPSHSFAGRGTYNVILMATGSANCSDASSQTIEVLTNTAIQKSTEFPENISLYPNPSSGKYTLEMNLNQPTIGQIKVYSLIGQEIWKEEKSSYFKDKITLDLGSLSNGVYMLQLELDGFLYNKKLIKN